MSGGDQKKFRNEIKYLCSEAQLRMIENRIKGICSLDANAGQEGSYRIRSLYFDDYYNTCFYENENGTDPREKFRIRIYNENVTKITLECKQKKAGKNHKESCGLAPSEMESLLRGRFSPSLAESPKLLRKFYLNYQTRLLRPKVIVEYERTPYVYRDGNVRITFDRNISSSKQVGDFLKKEIRKRPVMPYGKHVLEIKYDEFLPDFLYNITQQQGLQRTAYSKYYLCRKYS